MKKFEDLKIKEIEVEWQNIQDDPVEWSMDVESMDEDEQEESRDEQRRKEALFEAADYEDTEFEDIGFVKKESNEPYQGGRMFPFWILPIAALLVCIPLVVLAYHKDQEREALNKQQTEALVASMNQQEQTQEQEETIASESTASDEKEDNHGQSSERDEVTPSTEDTESSEATQTSEEIQDSEETDEAEEDEGEDGRITVSSGDVVTHISGDSSMTFEAVNDVVSAIDATNLRTVPSTEGLGIIMAQLKRGQNVARTGINEETGWSRIEYMGQELYAVTQFLTTEVSDAPLVGQQTEQPQPMDISTVAFVDCDDQVKPTRRVNLRTEPSTALGNASIRVQVDENAVLHRTGYTADGGWSRVEYNGEVLYIVNTYTEVVQPSTETPQEAPTQ